MINVARIIRVNTCWTKSRSLSVFYRRDESGTMRSPTAIARLYTRQSNIAPRLTRFRDRPFGFSTRPACARAFRRFPFDPYYRWCKSQCWRTNHSRIAFLTPHLVFFWTRDVEKRFPDVLVVIFGQLLLASMVKFSPYDNFS